MNPKKLKINKYYLIKSDNEEYCAKYIKKMQGDYKYRFAPTNQESHFEYEEMTDKGVNDYVIRELTYEETMAEIL